MSSTYMYTHGNLALHRHDAHARAHTDAPVPLERFFDTAMPLAQGHVVGAVVGQVSDIEQLLSQRLVALQGYH